MIALLIPVAVEIREGMILEVPETPEQAARRRRDLALLVEPSEVKNFAAAMDARIARARAARIPARGA
jgi:hypothetical protein